MERKFICSDCKKEYVTKCREKLLHRHLTEPRCKWCNIKKTNLERFGVDNAAKSQVVKDKVVNTNLKRYGCKCSFQNKEVQEKYKKTCLEKYGSEWALSSQIIKEKRFKTFGLKYGKGVKVPLQVEKFKNQHRETMFKKYGVEFSMQRKDVQKQMFKKYLYNDVSFDSEPELAFYVYMINHNKNIKRSDKRFQYYDDAGKKHYYFPDFDIDDTTYEIKGDFLKEFPDWKYKEEIILREHIVLIFCSEYKQYLDYIDNAYGKDYLNQFKRTSK